jgi:hypothetical protein
LRIPGDRGSFAGDPEGYGRRVQGTGISILGGPVGEIGRIGRLGNYVSSGYCHLSISLYGGPVEHMGRDPFTGKSCEIIERGLRKRDLCPYGRSVKGTWRGIPYWVP